MALTEGGHPDPARKVGDRVPRTETNICAYVLLDPEPLIMPDISKDPIWKNHPNAGPQGYAGQHNLEVQRLDDFSRSGLLIYQALLVVRGPIIRMHIYSFLFSGPYLRPS